MTLTMKCPHCGKPIELEIKPVKTVPKPKKPAHVATKKSTKSKTKVKKK